MYVLSSVRGRWSQQRVSAGIATNVVTPTHATFFGQATIDGEATNYRIDVDDLGERGLADTFKIQTNSGYTAAGTLRGGNIQIHR